MVKYNWISLILAFETTLFLIEVLRAITDKRNKQLRKTNVLEGVDFIDLRKGYRTRVSWFRVSLVATYLVLMVLLVDFNKSNFLQEMMVYLAIGAMVYVIVLLNIKVFIFQDAYFAVYSPFDPFFKSCVIEYTDIKDFQIYRALYNAYIITLTMKNGSERKIEFSAMSVPRNDLVTRIILNSKTGLNKDFFNARRKRPGNSAEHL